MGELSEDVKEKSKPQESQDRAICELRAEVRNWIKGVILNMSEHH